MGNLLNQSDLPTINENDVFEVEGLLEQTVMADSGDKYRGYEVAKVKGCPEILNGLYGGWVRVEDVKLKKHP